MATPAGVRMETAITAPTTSLMAGTSAGGPSTSTQHIPKPSVDDEGMDFNDTRTSLTSSHHEDGTVDRDSDNTRDAVPTGDAAIEAGWERVLSLREKRKQAKERKQSHEGDASQGAEAKHSAHRGRPRRRRLPPLPREDLKIVIRPHQGLPLRNVNSQEMARAIVEACQNKVLSDDFILRIKPGSNIAIVSTPDQDTARRVQAVSSLNINGRPHPINAYVTTGEGTVRGVIHGIEPHTPSATLKAHLRLRTQQVEIVDARMLGDSQSALITFFGDVVPRCVYYYGGEKTCRPYRNAVQFCRSCCGVGHHTDVCPQPDLPVCRVCEAREPADGHDCSPECAICGGEHPTGDRACLKRLKPLRQLLRRPSKGGHQRRPPHWFASEEEELKSFPNLQESGIADIF